MAGRFQDPGSAKGGVGIKGLVSFNPYSSLLSVLRIRSIPGAGSPASWSRRSANILFPRGRKSPRGDGTPSFQGGDPPSPTRPFFSPRDRARNKRRPGEGNKRSGDTRPPSPSSAGASGRIRRPCAGSGGRRASKPRWPDLGEGWRIDDECCCPFSSSQTRSAGAAR